MLEIIGYQRVGQSTMVLEMPIDPATVVAVSRDSLMAYVECQVEMIKCIQITQLINFF